MSHPQPNKKRSTTSVEKGGKRRRGGKKKFKAAASIGDETKSVGERSSLLLKRNPSERSNGLFSADILLYVAEFLTVQDLLRCHRVCKWWNSVLASNTVWKSLFLRTFGRPKQEPKEWLVEFVRITRLITFPFEKHDEPKKPANLKETKTASDEDEEDAKEEVQKQNDDNSEEKNEEQEEEDDDEEEEEEEEEEEPNHRICHIKKVSDDEEERKRPRWQEDRGTYDVYFPTVKALMHSSIDEEATREEFENRFHQLGLILFVLSENCNELDVMKDSVRIGYQSQQKPMPIYERSESDEDEDEDEDEDPEERKRKRMEEMNPSEMDRLEEDTEVVPLSRFCYAILTGQGDKLFSRMRRGDPGVRTSWPWHRLYEHEFELRHRVDKEENPFGWSVGVAPNVSGPFKPFVHYLTMFVFRYAYSVGYSYTWGTTKHGWLPIYMNASYYWYYWADIKTRLKGNVFSVDTSYHKGMCW